MKVEPVITGDDELGKFMKPVNSITNKCIRDSQWKNIGWNPEPVHVRQWQNVRPMKTEIQNGKRPLYKSRGDVTFKRTSGDQAVKVSLQDGQRSQRRAGMSAQAYYNTVFQSIDAGIAGRLEKDISDGQGTLKVEFDMPMLDKTVSLTDDELKQAPGSYMCYEVTLGAKMTVLIKRAGASTNNYKGSIGARTKTGLVLGANVNAGVAGNSQGPGLFTMEVRSFGGPCLNANLQKQTVNDLLDMIQTKWRRQVEESPQSWIVLSCKCYECGVGASFGNSLESKDKEFDTENTIKETEDRKEQEEESIREAEAKLKRAVVEGNMSEQGEALRELMLLGKHGQELMDTVHAQNEAKNTAWLELSHALATDDVHNMRTKRINIAAYRDIDPEFEALDSIAAAMIAIMEEQERARQEFNKESERLGDAIARHPSITLPESINRLLPERSLAQVIMGNIGAVFGHTPQTSADVVFSRENVGDLSIMPATGATQRPIEQVPKDVELAIRAAVKAESDLQEAKDRAKEKLRYVEHARQRYELIRCDALHKMHLQHVGQRTGQSLDQYEGYGFIPPSGYGLLRRMGKAITNAVENAIDSDTSSQSGTPCIRTNL